MSDPVLSYASPASPRPGTLRVAFWLNIVAMLPAVALMGYGVWALTLTTNVFVDADLKRQFLISGSILTGQGLLWTGLSAFCAFALRKRRWRRLTRVLAIFPLCLFIPFGTIAGLFTYSILGSPKIRAAYEEHEHVGL